MPRFFGKGDKMDMILGFLPTIVFGFIVFFITQVLKTILHKIFSNVKEKRVWKAIVLQSIPVISGALLAFFIPVYPFPEHFMNNRVVHTMFGAFVGYMSGHIYRAVKLQAESFIANLAGKVKKMVPTKNKEL